MGSEGQMFIQFNWIFHIVYLRQCIIISYIKVILSLLPRCLLQGPQNSITLDLPLFTDNLLASNHFETTWKSDDRSCSIVSTSCPLTSRAVSSAYINDFEWDRYLVSHWCSKWTAVAPEWSSGAHHRSSVSHQIEHHSLECIVGDHQDMSETSSRRCS